MSNYVIIDADKLKLRIEELEEGLKLSEKGTVGEGILLGSITQLKQILSQSTPLTPVIEETYWAGMQFVGEDKGSPNEYISNLKLNI